MPHHCSHTPQLVGVIFWHYWWNDFVLHPSWDYHLIWPLVTIDQSSMLQQLYMVPQSASIYQISRQYPQALCFIYRSVGIHACIHMPVSASSSPNIVFSLGHRNDANINYSPLLKVPTSQPRDSLVTFQSGFDAGCITLLVHGSADEQPFVCIWSLPRLPNKHYGRVLPVICRANMET